MTVARTADRVPRTRQWRIVVPVKGGAAAKSRLRAPRGVDRPSLARAFADDTVEAVLAAGARAVVVSADPEVRARERVRGLRPVADPGAGLDAAIRAGLTAVAAESGDRGGPVAVLLGDLPCLRPQDVRDALAACGRHDRAFVPDLPGTGTVLLAARRAADLRPSFGDGSAARHARDSVRLDLDLPRLRRDVDVEADLAEALRLGVGAHTAAVLARVAQGGDTQEGPAPNGTGPS